MPVDEAFTPFFRWKAVSLSSGSRAGRPSRMGRTLVYAFSHIFLPDHPRNRIPDILFGGRPVGRCLSVDAAAAP
jgi:hypothetical protein